MKINHAMTKIVNNRIGSRHSVKQIAIKLWKDRYRKEPIRIVRKCVEERCINISHWKELIYD